MVFSSSDQNTVHHVFYCTTMISTNLIYRELVTCIRSYLRTFVDWDWFGSKYCASHFFTVLLWSRLTLYIYIYIGNLSPTFVVICEYPSINDKQSPVNNAINSVKVWSIFSSQLFDHDHNNNIINYTRSPLFRTCHLQMLCGCL